MHLSPNQTVWHLGLKRVEIALEFMKSSEFITLDFTYQFNWQGNLFFCFTVELGIDPRKALCDSTNIQRRKWGQKDRCTQILKEL